MLHYNASTVFEPGYEFFIKPQTVNKPTFTHTHNYIEMMYVTSGNGIHIIDGIEYPLQHGGFFIIDLGHSHNLVFKGEAHYYDLYFSVDFFRSFNSIYENEPSANMPFLGTHLTSAIYFDTQQIPKIEYILTQLNDECSSRKPLSKSFLRPLVSLLFLEISRQIVMQKKATSLHNPGFVLPRIADYINEHFTEHLKIKDVAQKYNYNPTYFGRLFKKTYGISFEDYIKSKRLAYAIDLLESTTLPIDTVITKAGYNNRSFFFREFQKNYQCTPNEYRLKHLAKQNSDFLGQVKDVCE